LNYYEKFQTSRDVKILCGGRSLIGKVNVMNSKEKKLFLQQIKDLYGVEKLPTYVYFYINDKERLYVVNEDAFKYDFEEIRVNSTGLYIGTFMIDGFRFSIEGSQIFGKLATKNIYEIDETRRNDWIKGESINCEVPDFQDKYVLIKCGNDFFASAKVKKNSISNYIPKTRTQKTVFIDED